MNIGKLLMITGAVMLIAGLIQSYAPWVVSWFGKLPGDIYIRNKHSTLFVPVSSMIVVSILLSLLINLIFRK